MRPKQKKELIVLAVGIIVLLGTWVYIYKPSPKGVVTEIEQFKEKEISPISTQKDLPVKEVAKPAGTKEVRYTGRENRDPLDNSIVIEKPPEISTIPMEKKEVVFPKEGFLVSALIWDSRRPQAIINDKVVDIGERLNGGEIIGIDKEGVHVSFEGREVLLSIK